MGRLVCGCGVWECQSWVGSGAQERKEEEEVSSHIFQDVRRQTTSIISPQGAKIGYASFILPSLKFSMSALPGCFSSVEVCFLICEMGFVFPIFQGFLEIKLALPWNASYKLLGAKQKWYRNKDRGQWSDSSLVCLSTGRITGGLKFSSPSEKGPKPAKLPCFTLNFT